MQSSIERGSKLYEGKAKKLYTTSDPEILWVKYTNQATAGNGEKKAQIEGKGKLNNLITSVIFDLLKQCNINSHFIGKIAENEQLVARLTMFPLEIIVRNIAAGSFAKRYGVQEGTLLTSPVLEFCYKSDEHGDPFISQDAIVALQLATREQLNVIAETAYAINSALCEIFDNIGVTLVDFKIEAGMDSQGRILLADEITPDTCRLWDNSSSTDQTDHIAHLDKDLFRRDLGDIIPAYEEILQRLELLADQTGIERSIVK